MILPESVLGDLHYGARMLVRNVGSTLVTVVALAMGIGINTAVFTAYKVMVLRPLDARDAHEMVNTGLRRDTGAVENLYSYPDYLAYRDSLRSFSGLIAYRTDHPTFSTTGGAVPARSAESTFVFVVSENYFKVLGVNAIRGRTFDSMSVADLAATPSVLISENYWQRRLAGDPGIVGKTVYLNGVAVTIVGVTPHDFVGTNVAAPGFWAPASLDPLIHADEGWLRDRENRRYRIFGRLAQGVGLGQAQAEMSVVADRLRALHDPRSEAAKPVTAMVWPGTPFALPLTQYPGFILAIYLIMAASVMVLVVACANVGSLQLARARSRENELRTRLSLGASRVRVIRQLVTESGLAGLLAGGLALFFTFVILRVGVSVIANVFPLDNGTLVFDVTPDLRVFAFVSAISLAAGMLSGFIPALESSRSALGFSGRTGTAAVRGRRLQDVLVAAQVALSLVLMIAGSMAIRSSINTLTMDTGYESKRLVGVNVQFPDTGKYGTTRKVALAQELRTRLASLPGVADITSARPPSLGVFQTSVTDAGASTPSVVHYSYVQPNYFQILGIPLVLGGTFEAGSNSSTILSESAARQLWPGQNPIGRRLRVGPADERPHNLSELLDTASLSGPVHVVIGLVRDTRGAELDGSDAKRVYLPMAVERVSDYPIMVRTQGDTAEVIRAIDPLISSIDPNVTAATYTVEQMRRSSPPFLISTIAAAIAITVGILGLLLALMGIWGTVSYIVVLRTREVGIRMAIGAQKRDVLGLVLRESAQPVVVGLIAGMLLAAGASYLARGLLYGWDGVDGVSVAGVSLLFMVIAVVASYPPARRAMRVDPMVALRYE